jgi:hypothetical protein
MRVWAAAAALLLVAVSCGGDDAAQDLDGLRAVSGDITDDDFDELVESYEGICDLDDGAFAFAVARQLDAGTAVVIDEAVEYVCPGRIDELREILAPLPDADLSKFG